MNSFYVIQEIGRGSFWSDYDGYFRPYLWATKFDTEEEIIEYAKKRGIGVFKITKVYDTK